MSSTAIQLDSNKYFQEAHQQLQGELSTKSINPFALSKIDKISINVGLGRYDTKQKQEIADYLTKLTGQKPKMVKSRKSIASFKLREGDVVGAVVTLRGKKMQDFLLNLVYLALPRSRDFKGVKVNAFDKNYSVYSLGIENCGIFTAVGFDTSVQFGMQINIVFKTSTEHNKTFLEKTKFPFAKS